MIRVAWTFAIFGLGAMMPEAVRLKEINRAPKDFQRL